MGDTENKTLQLLINSFQDVTSRLSSQESKLDRLTNAVLSIPDSTRKQTKELINEMVPSMIDDRMDLHKIDCPLNSATKEVTKTNIKKSLLRNSIPPLAIKLDKIPKSIWYIVGGLIMGAAAKHGIDLSGFLK